MYVREHISVNFISFGFKINFQHLRVIYNNSVFMLHMSNCTCAVTLECHSVNTRPHNRLSHTIILIHILL